MGKRSRVPTHPLPMCPSPLCPQSEHERYLTEEIFKQPIIVYDYPKEIKVCRGVRRCAGASSCDCAGAAGSVLGGTTPGEIKVCWGIHYDQL